MMRAGVSAAIVAASIVAGSTAWSACPQGQSPSQSHSQSRNCVNLDGVPQISQQIVAGEHIPTPPKTNPVAEATPGYTGPAVGVSKMLRRAPTVGYRWAID
jgi:hypothetical protein